MSQHIIYGKCRHIQPLCINRLLSIYRVNTGSVTRMSDIQDEEAPYRVAGEVPTLADLESLGLSGYGHRVWTCHAEGCFRLSEAPRGVLTLTVENDVSLNACHPELVAFIERMMAEYEEAGMTPEPAHIFRYLGSAYLEA